MSLPPSDNSQPDLVNHSNEEILQAVVECIKNNDKHSLKGWLELWKLSPFPSPASLREETPLHVAAAKPEYKECLELLLEYSDSLQMNIDDETIDGDTALHIACQNGCDESVLILLQKRSDVDKSLMYDYSALNIAAEKGHIKIIQYLIDYGASIHEADFDGSTPLHKAALSGQLEVARFLIEKGVDIRSPDESYEIPLFLACRRSHYNMICLLVEHDSSTVNHQNYNEATPLMVASRNSPNEQCVRFLHENGASFSYQDWVGRLALHYAAKNGNVDVLRYVLEHTDASSIAQCFKDIPNRLTTNKPMDSLLCCAIVSTNIECLEMLLSSNKLSTSILQTPRFIKIGNLKSKHFDVYSPISLLFSDKWRFASEKFDLHLRFLLEHKLTMLDESLKMISSFNGNNLMSPFSEIFKSGWPFSKSKYYFHWLNTNGITIDYCLQCYYDNTQLFASFDDYRRYYEPVLKAVLDNNVEALILMMSTSSILEPDKLIAQLNRLSVRIDTPYDDSAFQCHVSRRIFFNGKGRYTQEEHCNIYKYLISLKPVFHTHAQLLHPSAQNNKWFPCCTPNAGQEFAESTLKQLCRTTIRQHLRKETLEDNLRDFRRNILELPLPPSLKDYLLFKS